MTLSKKTVIYTSGSPLKKPVLLLKSMLNDLVISRILAWRLIVRDISSLYRQSLLGYLWAILPPLANSLIFIFLNRANILNIESTNVPYPVYVFTGTVFWQLFVDSIKAPLKEINTNRAMLTKIDFPKEAMILSGIGQSLFSFMIKIIFLFVIIISFGVGLSVSAIFSIFPMFGLLILGTLIGILLVPIGVLYKDIQQGLDIIIQPLMYLAPVVYALPKTGKLAQIMSYNPITYLMEDIRTFVFSGIPGNLSPTCIILIITSTLALFGWLIYRIALPVLIERMDA